MLLLLLCIFSMAYATEIDDYGTKVDSASSAVFSRDARRSNSLNDYDDFYDFKYRGILYRKISSNEVAVASGDYNYDGSVSIADATAAAEDGLVGDIVIPETVPYQGKTYTVTEIDFCAFPGVGYNITSITLPSTIRSIGEAAFGIGISEKKLDYIICKATTPPSAADTFGYCSQTVLEETVLYVPGSSINTYKNANGWKQFNVKSIDEFEDNTIVVDGIAYEVIGINQAGVVWNSESIYSGIIEIPAHITHEGTTYSVTSIGNNAFSGCTGLTSVTIPESVTSIGDNAFSGCTGLTSVTIPESVTTIGNRAFSGCTGLKTVYYNAANIASFAYNYSLPFYNCPIERIVIGNNVTKIPAYFAYNLTGLTEITIPDAVTSIGEYAFSGCTGIKKLTWNAKKCSYNSMTTSNIEQVVIGSDVEVLPANFVPGSKITEVTIPTSVTSIGNNAFSGCTGLTSVTIPESVSRCEGVRLIPDTQEKGAAVC